MKKSGIRKMLITASVAGILLIGGSVYAATADELKQERLDARKAVLEQRVTDGKITQEQADAVLARMQENMANCDGTCDTDGDGVCDGNAAGAQSRMGQGRMGGTGGAGAGVCGGAGAAGSGCTIDAAGAAARSGMGSGSMFRGGR